MIIVMVGVANMSTVARKFVSNLASSIKGCGHRMNFHKSHHLKKYLMSEGIDSTFIAL
jgi:hypothetical protein